MNNDREPLYQSGMMGRVLLEGVLSQALFVRPLTFVEFKGCSA